MMPIRRAASALTLTLLALAGCRIPGKPGPEPEVPRPEAVLGFPELYNENCAACHGANGHSGPATDLANPKYLAWIDDATLRNVIANGEPGVLMPAFGRSAGGNLTDQQLDALVHGMRSAWSQPNPWNGATPPPYHATLAPNAAAGQAVYTAACARCHGADPQHPCPAGSVLDGSFLALINAQTLRTTLIPGRPDIGQPDFRGDLPNNQPLTDAQITDLSAWMLAQRPAHPGRLTPTTAQPETPHAH